MSARRWSRLALAGAVYAVAFVAMAAVGGLGYFHFANPARTCASCHEMTGVHSNWSASAHRTVHCRQCHGGTLTLDVHALESHVNRLVHHFTGGADKPVRLLENHLSALNGACANCHPQAFAGWSAGKHAATYAVIFLEPTQRHAEHASDECLRCHGMFHAGGVDDLLTPPDANGGRAFRDPRVALQPAVPCLACHQVHRTDMTTHGVSYYDHRERRHFPADLLPLATIRQGGRDVRVSHDPRQRLCLECHAPDATHQLGTADDRTPAGVHEGLSCLDCHRAHDNSAAASCGACHPAVSHCGIGIEQMDTTFRLPASRHNVHTVACEDCHPQGRSQGMLFKGR
ncbi:MAG TPA: hypothetical protein VHE13_03420 [Opitutus sp.]|nr:hypothetical protein [Opitutus sp.]